MRAVRLPLLLGSLLCASLLLVCSCRRGPAAQATGKPSLESDPRVRAWSREFLDGKTAELERDLGVDLASNKPHPLAASIWLEVHEIAGDRDSAFERTEPKVKANLELTVEAKRCEDADDTAKLAKLSDAQIEQLGPLSLSWIVTELVKVGQIDDGMRVAQSLCKRFSGWYGSCLSIAQCVHSVGQRDKALAWIDSSSLGENFKRASRDLVLRYLEGPAERVQIAERWVAAYPDDAWGHYYSGMERFQLFQFPEATRHLRRYAELLPFDSSFLGSEYALGAAKFAGDQAALEWFEASDAKTRATSKAGPDARRLLSDAEALYMSADVAGAGTAVIDAIKRYPEDADLHNLLAVIEAYCGPNRAEASAQAAQKASASDPYYLGAYLRALATAKKWDDILAICRKPQSASAPQFDLCFYEAHARIQKKNYEEAETAVQKLARLYPSSPAVPLFWGEILIAQGNRQDGREAMRAALLADPALRNNVAEYLAWVAGNDHAKQSQALEELIAKSPREIAFFEELANRVENDKPAELIAIAERAAKADPLSVFPTYYLYRAHQDHSEFKEAGDVAREAAQVARDRHDDVLAHVIDCYAAGSDIALIADGRVDTSGSERLLAQLDALEKTGVDFPWSQNARERLLQRLGRNEQAWELAVKAAKFQTMYIPTLFGTDFGGGQNTREAFRIIDEWIQRQPYNADALQHGYEFNAKWGGDELKAFRCAVMLERNCGRNTMAMQHEIRGHLGDSRAQFELYDNMTWFVEGSLRYVAWFDAARERAQTGREEVTIDKDTFEIKRGTYPPPKAPPGIRADPKALADTLGRVRAIEVDQARGRAYVSRASGLFAYRLGNLHTPPARLSDWPGARLALGRNGDLYAGIEGGVVVFPQGEPPSKQLFATGDARRHPEIGGISSVFVASDDSVWATAGASVFRYKDGKSDEFSYFKDPKTFPQVNDMLANVFETFDNRLFVVLSNESHRAYNGMRMRGGVCEFKNGRFVYLGQNDTTFVTGYTKIGPELGIAATRNEFVRNTPGKALRFNQDLSDPSYMEVEKKVHMPYFGTRGAKLGRETWLFGWAGGVVGYRGGKWFLPRKLNAALPDPAYWRLGGEVVHAVATDSARHVFVGTDRGLLIYSAPTETDI